MSRLLRLIGLTRTSPIDLYMAGRISARRYVALSRAQAARAVRADLARARTTRGGAGSP